MPSHYDTTSRVTCTLSASYVAFTCQMRSVVKFRSLRTCCTCPWFHVPYHTPEKRKAIIFLVPSIFFQIARKVRSFRSIQPSPPPSASPPPTACFSTDLFVSHLSWSFAISSLLVLLLDDFGIWCSTPERTSELFPSVIFQTSNLPPASFSLTAFPCPRDDFILSWLIHIVGPSCCAKSPPCPWKTTYRHIRRFFLDPSRAGNGRVRL